MANQDQLQVLKQGVENWNRWRSDKVNRNVNIDLRGAKLAEIDLNAAHLSGANLIGADLTSAELVGTDFREASLMETCFNKANLRNANLVRANLTDANLTDANLKGVTFTKASLWNSKLTGANLHSTDLVGVNLTGADLTKADLIKSQIGYTILGNNDLSNTRGLKYIRHVGPSVIGIDTIRRSKGKIPLEFLRSCGLSDLEIEFAKLSTPGLDPEQVGQITYEIHHVYCDRPVQFYSCFISYNSKDHKFAQRLHDDLQNNSVRCWFAPEDMKIGDEFRKAIGQQIRFRDKLLIILSENSIHSEWVGDEVEKALAEEKEQGMLKLFPIRLDNAVFEAKDDWAEKIRLRRHIGDFSNNYVQAFERLLRDLKTQ